VTLILAGNNFFWQVPALYNLTFLNIYLFIFSKHKLLEYRISGDTVNIVFKYATLLIFF